MENRLRQTPVGIIETTTSGHILDINDTATATIETPAKECRDADIREVFPKSAAGSLRAAFDGATVSSESFEEYYPRLDRWLAVDIHVDEAVIVYVRDRTGHRESEETVTQLRQRLDRIQRINGLVGAVLQRIIDASDRTDIGRTICERLSGTELYTFAWVADRNFSEDHLRMVAATETESEFPTAISNTLDDESQLPAEIALNTGETQLVDAVADDKNIPHQIRQAAFGHGLQSCLAVPLAYQDTIYGVVSVYSNQEDGFSQQERESLETLGSIAGFAIKALRQEDLLVADTITEVTLDIQDTSIPFVAAVDETTSEITLNGAVPRGDGSVICYLSMDTLTDDLKRELRSQKTVSDVRSIRTDQDPLLQVTVAGEMPVIALNSWGATVKTAEYTADSVRLVAEVPPDGDVRRLIETVETTVEEITLVAKEETPRSPEPVDAFRDTLGERLTDRQQTVLRTAYLSDYFESPRESTSEEVAETLDIAGSTMLYHLRRAQQELVATFLETQHGPERQTDTQA
ncbi:bacterio-opsin activator domain-containing protein [Haloarcula sediminis]|uniref:bacterio-opsin activator domain-containing protein n=1 Tax=Haloarcula sediminis TaxID=3111777 RepID=UPI002D766FC0|nr:bacterio-opsin activator domain-containing protein [Haloarcula sp. CK38]